jgi:hypothetical protein
MPQRDDIEAPRLKILQRSIRLHFQSEMFFGKHTRSGILFNGFHLPAGTVHRIGKVTGTRTYIQQTPRLAMRFMRYQTCFPLQHITAYTVVYGVHRSFFRIRVGNIIGSFVIASDFRFHRKILSKDKTAIPATAQMECLARSIMVYAGQGTLQMRSSTYRTSFYSEFIHRTFTDKEMQPETDRPH